MTQGNGHAAGFNPIEEPTRFIGGYEAPDWLVDGIIQKGRLYSLTSLTGHGKTAVVVDLSIAVQSARRFAGLDVTQGNVLYLAGENPQDLQGRMLGTKLAHNLSYRDFPHVLPATFPLDANNLAILEHNIAMLVFPLALIVIDTAVSFSPVEDDVKNMQQVGYAQTLRTLTKVQGNPAVIVLCHPIKNAKQEDLLPRGGGAFLNEMDGNLTLWSEEPGQQTRLHWLGKIRGPEFDALTFRLRQVPTGKLDKKGRPDMTVIAEPMDEFEAVNRAQQARADDEAVLNAYYHNPGWSQRHIANSIGWTAKEQYKVSRALKKLYDAKLIRSVMGEQQLTKAGEKFLESRGLL